VRLDREVGFTTLAEVKKLVLESEPFTVRDARTSLNVGKLVYGPDESVDIRARLRDAEGRPLVNTKAEALIYRRVAPGASLVAG